MPLYPSGPVVVGTDDRLRPSQANLRRWKTAVAGRNSAPANVLVLGDSMTAKGSSDDPNSARWTNRLRIGLQAEYMAGVGGRGYLAARQAGVGGDGSAFTVGGAPTHSVAAGLGRHSYVLAGSGDSLTTTVVCDRFQVAYLGYSGSGSFSVTIDGGSPTTVATTHATAKGYLYDSGALSSASHQVVLTWISGSAWISGVMFFSGDFASGIHMWEGSTAGTAADYNLGAVGEAFDHMDLIHPDVVILEFGIAEMVAATSTATFVANLAANVAKITTGNDALIGASTYAPSVVLLPVWAIGFAPYTTDTWLPYYRAMITAALANGWAVADVYDAAGSIGLTDPYSLTDSGLADLTHPSAKGNQLIADVVLRTLTV